MATILVVEDEESQRKILRDELKQNEYTVLEAADGVMGLQMALKNHPDLILLDVRMPAMDGMTMMHKLRTDPWGRHASIIILTNYDNDEAQLVQITTDMPSYFLIKANVPLDKVMEKIQDVLSSKKH